MFVTLAWICSMLYVTVAARVTTVNNNTEDMVALVQIFHHGERTPVSFYANDPWKHDRFWSQQTGELTENGKKMHYELGKFTRKRYGEFLPKYNYQGSIRAQTTDMDRTHMSCKSNLDALFNPNDTETISEDMPWQPVPIHIADGTLTTQFINCPLYESKLADILIRDPHFVELNKNYSDVYAHLSKHSGGNVSSVLQVSPIHDALNIEDRHGLKLPSWTNSVYPEPMSTLNGYAFEAKAFTTNMKRLSAGRWLKSAIYDYFSSFFNGAAPPSQIFQMWSADDINIACILNTLGAFNTVRQPALASSLYFELRNNSGSPYINVYYKDDDQGIFDPITISGCSFNCSLDGFKTALSDYLIDGDTWNEECSKSKRTTHHELQRRKPTSRPYPDPDPEVTELKKFIEKYLKERYT